MTLNLYETLALWCVFCRGVSVWDAIEELEPVVDKDSYLGDMLLVFLDDASPCDMSMFAILERRFASAPGGRDLRFAFALKSEHMAHYEHFHIKETPSAVFVRESIEMDRCSSVEDVASMVREVIAKYR